MASFIRQGASLTATALETAAGLLRRLAETDDGGPAPQRERTPEPAAAEPTPAPATKQRPASGTRSRISNPKAARKVRARQG
jgi:hypothetical protein